MDPLASVNAGWSDEPASIPSPAQSPPRPLGGSIAASPTSSTHQGSASASTSTFSRTGTSTVIRDPQVYGDPGAPLMHPQASSGAGEQHPPPPFLRVRIGALERNRKDLLIRYDASTNLPNFRTSLYRNMQRSYVEFQRFTEQAQLVCPQTIIPALPLPHTSAATDEEDDRLVRIALQRWFSRICEDPVLQQEDELRRFIESDFGYSPIPPPSAKRQGGGAAATQLVTAALSKVVRRGPLDDDDELASAKITLEKLEPAWLGLATSVGNLGKSRKALAQASSDVGAKLIALATDETDVALATAERKMGRVYDQLAAMAGAQIASENVVLNDSLAYQATNAKAARDALVQRTQILEDSQSATKAAINKRRHVERLKGSNSINPVKVDEAIADMDEAVTLETQLNNRLNAISQNLHQALRSHSRNAHEDVAVSLLEHARMSIIFNRQTLRELEALRPDLARVAGPPQGKASHLPSGLPRQSNTSPAPPNGSTPRAGPWPAGHAPPTPRAAAFNQPPHPQQPPLVPTTAPSTLPPPGQGQGEGQGGVSQSMFLPAPTPRAPGASAGPLAGAPGPGTGADPLSGAPMAQSMMLPGTGGRPAPGRATPRRLDERKAAKLLAGGF